MAKLFCIHSAPFKFYDAPDMCIIKLHSKKLCYAGQGYQKYMHEGYYVPDMDIIKQYVWAL